MFYRLLFITLIILSANSDPAKAQHITPAELHDKVMQAWHTLSDLSTEWNEVYIKASKAGSFAPLAPVTAKAKEVVKQKLAELKATEDIDGLPKIRASMVEYLQHDFNMYNDIEELGNLYSDPAYKTYFLVLLEKSAYEYFKISAELAVQIEDYAQKAGVKQASGDY